MKKKGYEEIEYFVKTYSAWLETQKVNDKIYQFSSFKNSSFENKLKQFINQLSSFSQAPKITKKYKAKTKIYINTEKGYRVLGTNINTKYLKGKTKYILKKIKYGFIYFLNYYRFDLFFKRK